MTKLSHFKPIKAKWHMLIFLSVSLGVYLFMFGYLYTSAQQVKAQAAEQVAYAAERELKHHLEQFILQAEQRVTELADWDEVHQQLNQSRYYFFWRNQRLKDSQYWRFYFNDLDLYAANGQQLIQKGPNDPDSQFLPSLVPDELTAFQLEGQSIDYRLFVPVVQRQSDSTLGFVGINLSFLSWLQQQQQFQYIDRNSLKAESYQGNRLVLAADLLANPSEFIAFDVIDNPVDNFLWALIQEFIFYVLVYAVVVAILFIIFFRFSLVLPLESISSYLVELKNKPGEVVQPAKHYLVSEFEDLQESLFGYNQALLTAKKELNYQHERYSKQSRIDALSGLLNRFSFDEMLQQLCNSGQSSNQTVGFILVDCDYFKAINDSYGLEVGDKVIKCTAQALKKSLPAHATIFRIGGDEFAAILNVDTAETLKDLAQNVFESLQALPLQELGIQERVTFSLGLSISAQYQTLQNLLKHADIALYKSKHSLHDKVQLFADDELSAAKTLMSNRQVGVILQALQTGEGIEMHLQPVVNVEGKVNYFEALVRIKKSGMLIFPGEIFNVVNHRHLDIDLDKQVIKAITQLFIEGKLKKGQGLSFNISPDSLLQLNLERELAVLAQFTQDYKIIVEITETSLIRNMELVTLKLNALREIGFLVALDDFGSGYSSIRYLANMPVDIVKFDMTLTRALELDDKTKGIIQATAKMIREAGYQLVMEGIETQAQFIAAQDAGATAFQGYLFGKPQLPVELSED
ncbi:hypothetical protein THIAE_08050 [Thiomicrospira aerophila AL3]|uniref:Diguanylate cyclase n=1 Tax=Thiomicrospira aerophila AL3 TaxID=717772 RepID=W0DYK0_9GAMM|nr:bifunctional diguanylate cyclase/phosphodiesterase [Thiomicrospira aerophila]AHF02348.1 hypothetical protein THIAE_08050 [Thiomicrospira aerophila AL3]